MAKKKTKTREIKPVVMSAASFKRWLKQMDFNHSQAAYEIGASRTSIIKWAEHGAPKIVQLACRYLANQQG